MRRESPDIATPAKEAINIWWVGACPEMPGSLTCRMSSQMAALCARSGRATTKCMICCAS